ncbi:MAG: antibiotic biosynthesis monooxygenase, partial [Desulfamplus sp.]|nr:antibiotic biosynthesis monooxygenase [Desulfamplus sp.]
MNVHLIKVCQSYVPTIDVPTGLPPQESNSNVVTIIEKWDSIDDLNVHLSAPHMVAYHKQVKN